jgi:hypothetical protein
LLWRAMHTVCKPVGSVVCTADLEVGHQICKQVVTASSKTLNDVSLSP